MYYPRIKIKETVDDSAVFFASFLLNELLKVKSINNL